MEYQHQVDSNKKCCWNCVHFEERTHFCRATPPSPVIIYDGNERMEGATSKFPVITKPHCDYCSLFDFDGNR